jgi:hypothetical protein
MLGLHSYLERYPGALAARRMLELLTGRLLDRLRPPAATAGTGSTTRSPTPTPRCPEALLRAGQSLDRPELTRTGPAAAGRPAARDVDARRLRLPRQRGLADA